MTESKKVEKKVEEVKVNKTQELLDNAHVEFIMRGLLVKMSYDKAEKKDVIFINDEPVKAPTYNELIAHGLNDEMARRIILFTANEYIIRGYSRVDVLCGIAK